MRYLVIPLFVLLVLAPTVRSDDDELWLHPEHAGAASAAQLVAATNPWTTAALRLGAAEFDLWDEPPLVLDKVPALHKGRLPMVRDDKGFRNDERLLPQDMSREDLAEDAVFWQAVIACSKVPQPVYAKAAKDNSHLTFGHLYTQPNKYRGSVVHFEGRLKQLKKFDAPWHARRKGIFVLYEAWIFLDQPGTHPLCVILPNKPESIAVGDNLSVRVAVDGYFFKRYRYTSGKLDEDGNNLPISTVMLIAPTLVPLGKSTASATTLGSSSLMIWLIGFGVGCVAFMVAMTWWFKRSDRLVQARLHEVRARRAAEAMAEADAALRNGEPAPPTPGPL